MKILARLIALILASAVFSLASGYILSRTLLHADYVLPRAKEAKVFDAGAQLLPTLAVPQEKRATKDGQKLHANLTTLFTPQYIETKLTLFAQQLEDHYRKGGPAPSLDLAALAVEAKAVGLDIDPATVKPSQIPAETDQHVQASIGIAKTVQSLSLIVTIVLALILLLISIKIHDYSGIINVLVINTLLFVITWVILRYAPAPLASLIPTDMPEIKPLTDALAQMVIRLAHDISTQYMIGAIILAVVSAAFYAIATISRLRHAPAGAKPTVAKAATA